jgi:SpoVK/Ycf46/Vps4 family AAA+-type ATPase
MSYTDFFREALDQPSHAIAYGVSQTLATRFPDRAILEGCDVDFDVAAYAEAGHCRLLPDETEHNQFTTTWDAELGIVTKGYNAWYEVYWRGQRLEVIEMTWSECATYFWILAESREVAEQFFTAVCVFNPEIQGELLVYEGGYWARNETLFRSIEQASFDQLVLTGNLAQELRRDLARFFTSKELYAKYSIPWKRGVLLTGPPGNGKTQAVKALVNELKIPCLYIKSFSAERRLDQSNIRAIFDRARREAPCVVVMEDLDSLVTDENRAFFLNEMDGFAGNNGVAFLATTNHPERLDPALVERPSRFDRKYLFDLPGDAERLAYLQKWQGTLIAELKPSDDGIRDAVALTVGFSYAYLKELVVSALMRWVDRAGGHDMDAVLLEQANSLRKQIGTKSSR